MSPTITSHDSPNPLRPYYRPPSIGLSQGTQVTTNSRTYGLGPKNSSASSYASSARSIFSDIDYTDYLSESSPSVFDSFKKQADEWLYRYVTILLAQPFDVAKTVLQAKSQGIVEEKISTVESSHSRQVGYKDSYQSDDSDPDEPIYFTPKVSNTQNDRRQYGRESSLSPTPKMKPLPAHQLALKNSDSILEVLGEEWMKEGMWGVWKGSNITFVYNVLLETFEKWTQGLLAAIFNIPEPGLNASLGIAAEISFAWTNLAVSVASAVTSSVILAPLDLIRTKHIMTPISHKKHSLMSQQQLIHSYLCHPSLLIPTILHSLVTPTIIYSTSFLLRSYSSIDPVLAPSTYQATQLIARLLELFLKLPLETVLRRAQMNLLKQAFSASKGSQSPHASLLTTVPIGEYHGIVGTMWLIIREEGTSIPKSHGKKQTDKPSKGQGLAGLWRGWRVGMWGLVGIWGLKILNGGNGGIGEF